MISIFGDLSSDTTVLEATQYTFTAKKDLGTGGKARKGITPKLCKNPLIIKIITKEQIPFKNILQHELSYRKIC